MSGGGVPVRSGVNQNRRVVGGTGLVSANVRHSFHTVRGRIPVYQPQSRQVIYQDPKMDLGAGSAILLPDPNHKIQYQFIGGENIAEQSGYLDPLYLPEGFDVGAFIDGIVYQNKTQIGSQAKAAGSPSGSPIQLPLQRASQENPKFALAELQLERLLLSMTSKRFEGSTLSAEKIQIEIDKDYQLIQTFVEPYIYGLASNNPDEKIKYLLLRHAIVSWTGSQNPTEMMRAIRTQVTNSMTAMAARSNTSADDLLSSMWTRADRAPVPERDPAADENDDGKDREPSVGDPDTETPPLADVDNGERIDENDVDPTDAMDMPSATNIAGVVGDLPPEDLETIQMLRQQGYEPVDVEDLDDLDDWNTFAKEYGLVPDDASDVDDIDFEALPSEEVDPRFIDTTVRDLDVPLNVEPLQISDVDLQKKAMEGELPLINPMTGNPYSLNELRLIYFIAILQGDLTVSQGQSVAGTPQLPQLPPMALVNPVPMYVEVEFEGEDGRRFSGQVDMKNLEEYVEAAKARGVERDAAITEYLERVQQFYIAIYPGLRSIPHPSTHVRILLSPEGGLIVEARTYVGGEGEYRKLFGGSFALSIRSFVMAAIAEARAKSGKSDENIIFRVAASWGTGFVSLFQMRMEVEGTENLPKEGPFVLMSTHSAGAPEFAFLFLATVSGGRFLVFVSKKENSQFPNPLWIVRDNRAIVFVKRGQGLSDANAKALGEAEETMAAGDSTGAITFASGSRTRGHVKKADGEVVKGRVQDYPGSERVQGPQEPLKLSAFWIGMNGPIGPMVPIIPTAVTGVGRLDPKTPPRDKLKRKGVLGASDKIGDVTYSVGSTVQRPIPTQGIARVVYGPPIDPRQVVSDRLPDLLDGRLQNDYDPKYVEWPKDFGANEFEILVRAGAESFGADAGLGEVEGTTGDPDLMARRDEVRRIVEEQGLSWDKLMREVRRFIMHEIEDFLLVPIAEFYLENDMPIAEEDQERIRRHRAKYPKPE